MSIIRLLLAVWARAWRGSVGIFAGMLLVLAQAHSVCCCYNWTFFFLSPAPCTRSSSPAAARAYPIKRTLPLH
jgi:hypothetical protein